MKRLIVLSIIMFVVWILNFVLISFNYWDYSSFSFLRNLNSLNLAQKGQIGDSFGAINALFSGLAFAGVIYTIILQREELNEQHKEQTLQRERFEQQNKTLKLQQFENTFFNLVKLHHQIVYSVFGKVNTVIGNDRVELKWENREYFKQTFIEFTYDYVQNKLLQSINNEYKKYYEHHKTNLGHYFRNLYRIFKFVNETEFYSRDECNSDEELYLKKNFDIRYKYTSMIRAQLSDYELGWLFYNCACEYGREKFLPLVNKYKLLKNLSTENGKGDYIIHEKLMKSTYNPIAFGLHKWIEE